MNKRIKVTGISGSLREESYNKKVLKAAVELKPEIMDIEIADIGGIPLFNEDVQQKGFPEEVNILAQQISGSDALLIVTPEYNYSVPGVLKNAIDWLSRVPEKPLNGKPAAVMGASSGMGGTMRAQYHLRQTAVFLNLLLLNKPEVMIAKVKDKFDDKGYLTDEPTKKQIAKQLEALLNWTMLVKGT